MSTETQVKYTLTAEHEAMLPMWADKWIKNAMSVERMTEADRELCTASIHAMYKAANLPAVKSVVYVPSPFVASFAGGFAAAVWHNLKNPNERVADCVCAPNTLDEATLATLTAFEQSVYHATHAACAFDGWGEAHLAYVASTECTLPVPQYADSPKTWSKWFFIAGANVKRLAQLIGVGEFGLLCAEYSYRMSQGGNQWSSSDAFYSFFQDIVKLDLPEFANYQHWRNLSEHSSFRIVHDDFVIISDRPELLTVDEANRPHSDNGPFCRWRDGTGLYSVHAARTPAWVVEHPSRITIDAIEAETNTEIQRVMIERYTSSKSGGHLTGWDAYVADAKMDVLDHDERWGTLFRNKAGQKVVLVINRSPEPNGTYRRYTLPVDADLRPVPDPRVPDAQWGEPQTDSALNAVASTFGMTGPDYAKFIGGPENES